MARKQVEVVINDPASRDYNRRYVLTEMPASQGEKFAARCFLALAKSGAEIPADVRNAGMAGLAVVGFQMLAGLEFADAAALMDEMMGCVQYAYDPSNAGAVRPLIEIDIEEVATRVRLRSEVFTLHTGFSLADVPSMLTQAPATT
jgi:hypothetical protein